MKLNSTEQMFTLPENGQRRPKMFTLLEKSTIDQEFVYAYRTLSKVGQTNSLRFSEMIKRLLKKVYATRT